MIAIQLSTYLATWKVITGLYILPITTT